MTYTPVPEKTTGDLWSAADHNTYIRDNFAAGVPDIFTTAGDMAVASGADAAMRLPIGTTGQLLMVDSTKTSKMKYYGAVGVFARYKKSGAQTLTNNTTAIINFQTQDYDTLSRVATGAAWKFTAGTNGTGKYLVAATLLTTHTSIWGVNEKINMAVYKNGTLYATLDEQHAQAVGDYEVGLHGVTLVPMNTSDYIDVRCVQDSGGNVAIQGSVNNCHIAIARLP